jgi:hypothetical protein
MNKRGAALEACEKKETFEGALGLISFLPSTPLRNFAWDIEIGPIHVGD